MNKTNGQKVGELIDSLENGYILYREMNDEKQYFIQYGNQYEVKGWASALCSSSDCLMNMIQFPDNWKVFPNFNMFKDKYPYPWSSKWVEKIKAQ